MLRKPSLLLLSYNNIHALYCSNSSLGSHSVSSRPPHAERSERNGNQSKRRDYATKPRSASSDDLPFPWPCLSSATETPTPYQIFHLTSKAPYSKRRFYELVKIYHPDRSSHEHCFPQISSLPHSIKIERYRLIVAANDILSDPVKRKAYDSNGAGWDGCPEYGVPNHHRARNSDNKWSGFDNNDSPYANATWEDWEKWYQRRDGQKQKPVFVSNGGFLSLIVVAIFLGAFEQSLRVNEHQNLFKRQVEIVHEEASKVIQSRKKETQTFGNKDQRLQNFLKTRDPHGFGIEDPHEERYKKLLPEPEVCMSEGIHQQGQGHDEIGER